MAEGAERAYLAGLKMLARRELSEAQVRTRLERRRTFDAAEINAAIVRLRRERALDDRRTALACARTEVRVKRHGRTRVLRQVESLGISRAIARAAVNEVFAEVDEKKILDDAIAKRVRRRAIGDSAEARRVHRYLVVQGFDPAEIATALRKRTKNARYFNGD
jgi:SOS response regulatory protein OraA/RecX